MGSPNFRGSTSKSLLLSSYGEHGVAGDPPKKGRKGSTTQLAVAKCEIYRPGSISPFIPAKTCHQLPSENGKTTQVKEKLSIKIFQRVSLASLVSCGAVGVSFLGWFWARGAAGGGAGAGAVLQAPSAQDLQGERQRFGAEKGEGIPLEKCVSQLFLLLNNTKMGEIQYKHPSRVTEESTDPQPNPLPTPSQSHDNN